MRRLISAFLTAFAVMTLTAGTALGAVNPKGDLPTATFDGASVTVTGGNFSGLGNIPAWATLTVDGIATYFCENPTGHRAPGQNPVDAAQGTTGPVELPTTKNGRATIPNLTASVSAPATPSAQQVGCGGKGSTQWTVVLDELIATSAHLVITHGVDGPEIFCRDYELGGDPTGTDC
jgi:hypothetical protein